MILLCQGALGTRPEAPGGLGIDSTSIEQNRFVARISKTYLYVSHCPFIFRDLRPKLAPGTQLEL